jgi:hypothetical protein
MAPATFIKRLRELGLYVRFIGQDAAQDLRCLMDNPSPVIESKDRKRFSEVHHIGSLIRVGFAKLDTESRCYIATDEGRKWIGKLEKAKLLTA